MQNTFHKSFWAFSGQSNSLSTFKDWGSMQFLGRGVRINNRLLQRVAVLKHEIQNVTMLKVELREDDNYCCDILEPTHQFTVILAVITRSRSTLSPTEIYLRRICRNVGKLAEVLYRYRFYSSMAYSRHTPIFPKYGQCQHTKGVIIRIKTGNISTLSTQKLMQFSAISLG